MSLHTILVVDDNEQLLRLSRDIFEIAEYNVVTAEDGEQALVILNEKKIDLVVTDILMPNIDGYILCYTIRTSEKLKNIPVIIYSATYTSSSDEEMAMEIGADKFLRKPAPMNDLIAAASSLLSGQRKYQPKIPAKPKSLEATRLYNEGLVNKLERRNFELEEAKGKLEQGASRLKEAQAISNIGSWEIDMASHTHLWSDQMFRIYGIEKGEAVLSPEYFLSFIHPEDVDVARQKVERAFETLEDSSFEFRFIRKSGELRYGYSEYRFEFDKGHKPLRLYGIIQDVTEKTLGEKALQSAHERLLFHVENTPLGLIEWDNQLLVKSWSKRAEEIFGWTEREFRDAQKGGLNHVFAGDWPWVRKISDQLISGEVIRNRVQHRCNTKNGNVIWCEWFNSVLRDKEGKVITIMSMVQDITSQKKISEELEKLSLVASKTNNAIMIINKDGYIEWVNAGFTNISEYKPEEVIGRKMAFLNGPDTDPFKVVKIAESLMRGRLVSEELINYTKSGNKYWVKVDITPVFDDHDRIKNFIVIQSDITELKEFENSITSIARELSSLIENANVPIFGIDLNGGINEWNGVTSELTGYSKNSVMGSGWAETFVDPAVRDMAQKTIGKVLLGTGVNNFELPVVTKNKKRLTLLLSASPRRSSQDAITGVIFVAQNVTELIEYRLNLEKKVEERTQELHEALSKERELVDMKSKFVSIASHEFRTPLSTISVATGLIRKHQEKLSTREIDKKLENIEKQVEHMTHMLDDVLLVEKASAGKIKIQLKEIRLFEFFQTICSEVESSRGSTHKIRLSGHVLLPTVTSDEKLLRSIFINLLTNAIKFSPEAQYADVSISGYAEMISVAIKDYGIGIPPEDIKSLFEPFFRGGNVNAIQGTGLGLSIIKKSLTILKGSITVKSVLGQGTEILVTLPTLHA